MLCGRIYTFFAFILECLSSVIILFAGYAIVKNFHEGEEALIKLAAFLLTFFALINASLWIDDYFVKRNGKLIRTSIVLDSVLIVIIFALMSGCHIFGSEISELLIEDIENLRSLQNTFGVYKFVLEKFESFLDCCKVPSLINYGASNIRFCCIPNGLECVNLQKSCDNLSYASAIFLIPLCLFYTIKLFGKLIKYKEIVARNQKYERLNKNKA